MDEREKLVYEIIERYVRPRTRVDGGNIAMEKLSGDVLEVGAYADCATCTCGEQELSEWIGRQVRERTGLELHVVIRRHVPYYAR